jgi:O-antigen ligase
MHNTYLDLTFEYGLVPMALFFALAAIALGRLAVSAGGAKVWLFYLAGIGAVAMGQHLLYSFSSMVATLPAAMVLSRELLRSPRAPRPPRG